MTYNYSSVCARFNGAHALLYDGWRIKQDGIMDKHLIKMWKKERMNSFYAGIIVGMMVGFILMLFISANK